MKEAQGSVEAWGDIVSALSALPVIGKSKTASAGKFSYDYADLADVVTVVTPILAEHNLVAVTPIIAHGDGLAVNVQLFHKSGFIHDFGLFPFPAGHDAQATGSAVTYHRRYALLAALGVAVAGEDDDGQAASQRASKPVKRRARKQTAGEQAARAAAKRLGDAAATVVPSIIEEVTGKPQKLADLSEDQLAEITSEILVAAHNNSKKEEEVDA